MRRRNASTGKQLYGMDGNIDMRVKLEYQGEIRILPISRPVMIEQLQKKITATFFGEELGINYENGETFIPILGQTDLDKAIALLDQSPHLTSLRLTLTPKTITQFIPEDIFENNNIKHLINGHTQHTHPSLDDLLTHKVNKGVRPGPPVRSTSNPNPVTTEFQEDDPRSRSKSMYFPRTGGDFYDDIGRRSPPPGHYPIESQPSHSQRDVEETDSGGVFIPCKDYPDDFRNHDYPSDHELDPDFPNPSSRTNGGFFGFNPLSPRDARQLKDDSTYGSLSLSPLSRSHMSINSEGICNPYEYENRPRNRRKHGSEKRRPLSDLIPDSFTVFEYDSDDNTSMKSEPYPKSKSKSRHRSVMNLDSVDSWMDRVLFSNRATSTSSIGGLSSNSSGLVPDYDSHSHDVTNGIRQLTMNTDVNTDINFRWKQCRQIGAGAFGTVYLCVDLDTGKEMAMKCVETGVINTATLKEVEVLKTEIQLYKTLKHERIVNYYGTVQDSKTISIFMEYMEGGSIHSRISKEGALSEEEASKYCRQILEGIHYLHNKNIIHRDIKGANILLDSCNNCKLADFGASRQIQTIRSKTGCKSVHGTPYWMSPEVINGAGYGRKADIWSLGCTALEMLTTKPPWFHFEPMAALFKIATQPTIPHFPPHTSTFCMRFIEDCLERDPHIRPKADDLLQYKFVQR